MAATLDLLPGQMPYLPETDGIWLFHFWGDLYGELLARVLQMHFPAGPEEPRARPWNEHCLHVPVRLTTLPPLDGLMAERQMRSLAHRVEPLLELGRFHNLLHPQVADRALLDQCDLPRFMALYQAARPLLPPPAQRDQLLALL